MRAPARHGKTVVFGRADNPVNFVSAPDVARFVELAAMTDQLRDTITDLGGPQNLSLVQFVETFSAALGFWARSSTSPARDAACSRCWRARSTERSRGWPGPAC